MGSVFGGSGGLSLDANSNNILFYAGDTERLRLASDGKLGLGTASPEALAHIRDGFDYQLSTTTDTRNRALLNLQNTQTGAGQFASLLLYSGGGVGGSVELAVKKVYTS